MTFRYATAWAYIELVVLLAMTVAVYVGLRPEWWGWLLYSPLFLYLFLEGVRKVRYALSVEGDRITVGSFKRAQYFASRITALNVWEFNGGHIAVVDLADGSRFHFPSRLRGFDELVRLLREKAGLPAP